MAKCQNSRTEKLTVSAGVSSLPRLQNANISTFPPEILSIIFKFVHEVSPQVNEAEGIVPNWMVLRDGVENAVKAIIHREMPTNFNSPRLFPYSLAAVSPLWSEILASHPEFWTVVVFYIDSPCTTFDDASLLLQRCQNLPIHVVITRREQARTTHYEKAHIAAFVNLIVPYLSQCVSIHIDAALSSSLPIVQQSFTTPSPKLAVIALTCDGYDSDECLGENEDEGDEEEDEESRSTSEIGENRFVPNLRRLVVDGRNFLRRGDRENEWISGQWAVKQLTITHLRTPDLLDYDLSYFFNDLSTFITLESLKLHQVHILPLGLPGKEYLHIRYLHLESVQEIFIKEFWKLGRFPQLLALRITRSLIPLSIYLIAPSLILEDIPSDLKLVEVVRRWEGTGLWIERCAGFSDSFLNTLATPRKPKKVPAAPSYVGAGLCTLFLYQLSNFSVTALKNLVQQRNSAVNYQDPNWRTTAAFGPAIKSIAVIQCATGKPSAAEVEWFRSRLLEFYWVD